MNITSRITGETLHIIHRKSDFTDGRVNIVEPNQFIQCATLKLPKDTTFKPHKHIVRRRTFSKWVAQESWVVIRGNVKVIMYDIDDTILHTDVLTAGDISITLRGGHNYVICGDDTLVYEFKTGSYQGQEKDKEFINQQ